MLKIRTDEIIIKEESEIRELACQFNQMFKKLNEKNIFSNNFFTVLDKVYIKSKEILIKPPKDNITDEVK